MYYVVINLFYTHDHASFAVNNRETSQSHAPLQGQKRESKGKINSYCYMYM